MYFLNLYFIHYTNTYIFQIHCLTGAREPPQDQAEPAGQRRVHRTWQGGRDGEVGHLKRSLSHEVSSRQCVKSPISIHDFSRWDAVVSLTSRPNIDVNLCGPDGMTPLLCAAGSGHSGVVER